MFNTIRHRPGAGIITASVIIGGAFVICTVLLGSTLVKVKGLGQTIRVTGAAYEPIVSDYALWEGRINVSAPSLDSAYAKIKDDLKTVEQFLAGKGFSSDDYEVGTVLISKQFNRDRDIIGYFLGQSVTLEMEAVDRVTKLAKSSSVLIEKGIEFESRPPRYIFMGLEPLKLEMIAAATKNAKERAERLASSTGRTVGPPRSAHVGVFQIRPLHSQEVSDYGMNDQSSVEKEIVCTVHIDFLIE